MTEPFRDYYSDLGLPRTASDEQIGHRVRELRKELHPDLHGHESAEQREWIKRRWELIDQAFQKLGDSQKRALYNYDWDRRYKDVKFSTEQAVVREEADARPAPDFDLVDFGTLRAGDTEVVVEIPVYAEEAWPSKAPRVTASNATFWRMSEIDPTGDEYLRLRVTSRVTPSTPLGRCSGTIVVSFGANSATIQIKAVVAPKVVPAASVPAASRTVNSTPPVDRTSERRRRENLYAEIGRLSNRSRRYFWLLAVPIGWPGILSFAFIPIHGADPPGTFLVSIPLLVIGSVIFGVLAARDLRQGRELHRLRSEL